MPTFSPTSNGCAFLGHSVSHTHTGDIETEQKKKTNKRNKVKFELRIKYYPFLRGLTNIIIIF